MIGAAYEYLLKDFADSAGQQGRRARMPFPAPGPRRTTHSVDEQITSEEAGLRKLKATGQGIADGLLTGKVRFRDIA
ncbi:hypothetical protein [Streptomyces sp. NPDC005336]|uniref:hypothetical protein n=1 Tax=Streptomyces sp. NPDC005336 TaxID=3157035 RepID=UPI0033B59B0A